MRNSILITFVSICLLFTFNSCKEKQNAPTNQTPKSAKTESNADILLVKYHADWCGSCKALSPLLKELNGQLAGKKTKYVELDLTDDNTKSKATSMAAQLGISHLLAEKQKTGYVAIIDADSKKVLGKLTKTQSANEMYQAVIGHL